VKMFDAGKTRMIGLPYSEKTYDDMLSRFPLIPESYGQTDRQICYINIARQYANARYADVCVSCGFRFIHRFHASILIRKIRKGKSSA